MLTLILDTSTERSVLALAKGSNVLFKETLPFGLRSSHFFFEALQRGLSHCREKSESIQKIAVAVGPGSFTGIRVAVSFAQGLSLSRGIPVTGFSTLRGFVSDEEGCQMAVVDARLGGAYVALFESKEGEIEEIEPPQLVPFEKLAPLVQKSACLITPFKEKLEVHIEHPKWIEQAPNVASLARHVEKKFLNGEKVCSGELEPVYLREMTYSH